VCIYRWPGLLGTDYGVLDVPLKQGFEVRNSEAWLNKVLSGVELYQNLPMLYNGGFIEVSTLLSIKAQRGQFYHSCIPDVYSAMAIASTIDDYLYVFEPLAIDGVSGHSTGTSLVKRTLDDSSVQKFFSEDNIPLHPEIPPDSEGRVPRAHQAWMYESYLQSRFLRSTAQDFTHEEQLEITLARPDCDPSVREWATRFAALHRLDFNAALANAEKRRPTFKRLANSARLSRALHTYYVSGNASTPLVDVHQASVTAGSVLDSRPGKLQSIRNLGAKALSKVKIA
jgi:hypothetical protein